MPGIDESLTFYPLGIAVLTISDTRTLDTDTSGALLAERLQSAGHNLVDRDIVKDEIDDIREQLNAWLANPAIEIILTTGGTGFSPRDNTPEAVKPLLKREMDGFSIAFHQKSLQSVGVATMQSRAELDFGRRTAELREENSHLRQRTRELHAQLRELRIAGLRAERARAGA